MSKKNKIIKYNDKITTTENNIYNYGKLCYIYTYMDLLYVLQKIFIMNL